MDPESQDEGEEQEEDEKYPPILEILQALEAAEQFFKLKGMMNDYEQIQKLQKNSPSYDERDKNKTTNYWAVAVSWMTNY